MELSMVVHGYNRSTQEAEAEGFPFQGHPGIRDHASKNLIN